MSYNNKQKHRDQGGFTLVEIMIALLVFMVIMLGVAAGLLAAIRTNKGNVVRDEALRIAESELNQLKGLQFSDSGVSGNLAATSGNGLALPDVATTIRGVPITFARTKRITDVVTAINTLKTVEVVVGWNDPYNAGGALLTPTLKNRQLSVSTILVMQ